MRPGPHAEVALVVKGIRGKGSGEKSMVAGLLRHLLPDMLLLWDRGFFSYSLWKSVVSRPVQLLARVAGRLVLRPIQSLSALI